MRFMSSSAMSPRIPISCRLNQPSHEPQLGQATEKQQPRRSRSRYLFFALLVNPYDGLKNGEGMGPTGTSISTGASSASAIFRVDSNSAGPLATKPLAP